MCKCANKLIALAVFIALPLILSACGGAPAVEDSDQSSSATINKPGASDNQSSARTSSAGQSTVKSVVASSKPVTAEQNYSRISKSSSSASVGNPSTADLIPPQGTALMLDSITENSVTLDWDEATDNVGISHYVIERDGRVIALVGHPTTTIHDKNLSAATSYNYTIRVIDLAGIVSEFSPLLTVRTLSIANNSRASSSTKTASSFTQSSKSVPSQSSISNSSKSSSPLSSSAKSSSSTVSSASSSTGKQSATITWNHPNKRENGQFLELDEIRGYEIRYRKTTDTRYSYIVINSNRITQYTHADASNTEFEIAVVDTNGVYSHFVKVSQ